MSRHTDVRTQEIPVPEPGLTPEAVIERARALIPAVRAHYEKNGIGADYIDQLMR